MPSPQPGIQVAWARERGYVAITDPWTGEVHEVALLNLPAPRWWARRAMEAKAARSATQQAGVAELHALLDTAPPPRSEWEQWVWP